MQAVILAGGKGTRLQPLTFGVPKPLIVIHGKSFLQYQLEYIKSFAINEVLVLVCYLGEMIKKRFGNGSNLGLKISYSYEETPLGTGGALKNAEDELAEEFLLLNGDTFLAADYTKLIEYYHQCNKVGMIVVYENSQKIVSNNIMLGEKNLVIGYNKRDAKGMTHIDAGVMVFKKRVLDFIPESQVCSLEEEIFPKLIQLRELVAFPTNQRFYDMGSFEGLREIKAILK